MNNLIVALLRHSSALEFIEGLLGFILFIVGMIWFANKMEDLKNERNKKWDDIENDKNNKK